MHRMGSAKDSTDVCVSGCSWLIGLNAKSQQGRFFASGESIHGVCDTTELSIRDGAM